MPLIKTIEIDQAAVAGIWKASESAEFFLPLLPPGYMTGYESSRFNERRKKEFLASRFLLRQMLGDDGLRLTADDNGKPGIAETRWHISLSHSKEMVAAMASETALTGIDIEEIHPRVMKVMNKFLNSVELNQLGKTPELWKVTLCWSAKESIYKMLNIRGLSFAGSMMIRLPEKKEDAFLTATVNALGKEFEQKVYFELTDGFILTYCLH